jgi:hypothetical protein
MLKRVFGAMGLVIAPKRALCIYRPRFPDRSGEAVRGCRLAFAELASELRSQKTLDNRI